MTLIGPMPLAYLWHLYREYSMPGAAILLACLLGLFLSLLTVPLLIMSWGAVVRLTRFRGQAEESSEQTETLKCTGTGN